MNRLHILSGLGSKGPACFRLHTNDKTWLLDCGFGPDEDSPFDPRWLDGVDAVFITHDHIDHIGGAEHAVRAGLPIYTTAQTARALPSNTEAHILPEQGQVTIDGVRLTTGRNGHALGGVWMHFDLGDGVFYSGDWSEESHWFAFDTPPPAATAVLDCSYHLDAVRQQDRKTALDALLARLPGQILLPVPASGRAGELALHLMQHHGTAAVQLDDTCRQTLQAALDSATLAPSANAIRPLLDRPADAPARFFIYEAPNADSGQALMCLRSWQSSERLGRDAHVVFTGHTNAHAQGITSAPGGHFQRWNVHPPLGDQLAMLRRLGAQQFVPAFCAKPDAYRAELDPNIELCLHRVIPL